MEIRTQMRSKIKKTEPAALKRSALGLLMDWIAHSTLRRIIARAQRTGMFNSPLATSHFDLIGQRVISTGHFELTQFDALDRLVEDPVRFVGQKIDWNGCFIDVGANIGLYTLRYAPVFQQTLSVEPNPATFHLLKANILLSGLECVKAICVGASDGAGQATLTVPRSGMLGWATMHKQPSGNAYSISVPTDTLDNLTLELSQESRVALIKIDVEGHELQVLEGAKRLLLDDGPAVLFENLSEGKGREIGALLSSMGYDRFFTFARKLSLLGLLFGLPVEPTRVSPTSLPKSALILAFRRSRAKSL